MSEDLDLNSANRNNSESNTEGLVQHEFKETQSIKKSEDNMEKEQNNCCNSNIDITIIDKTLKEKDKDPVQKNHEREQNYDIHKKLSRILDSDSEDENMFTSKSKSKKAIYESSEEEKSDSNCDNKFKQLSNDKNNVDNVFNNNFNHVSNNTNSSDNVETILGTKQLQKKVINSMQSRFQSLIDSESEEEEEEEDEEEEKQNEKQLSLIKSNKKFKRQKENDSKSEIRKVSLRASKEEAMKQIQSETQRLVRKTEVSLPYHRPKQRTLQEFLCRKKVITALPKAPTMAAKLKMSSAIVDEVLKEKEKEAEIFYKSSDSEEETIENNPLSVKKHANVECKQELTRDNVSRKLFVDNSVSIKNNEEQNNVNVVHVKDETLIETKKTENNEAIVNDEITDNMNDSLVVEIHTDSNDAEKGNQVSKSEIIELLKTKNTEVDSLIQKDITETSENENKEEEICSDNKKDNLEITNEISDTSTQKINDDYVKIVRQSLELSVNGSDEYKEYGLPPPKFDDSPDINEKKTLLNLKSVKPKLIGTPGTMINLSDNIKPNKKGINALIDRFMHKHSKINDRLNDTCNVTAMHVVESPNGLSVVKETLPYKLPTAVNEDPKLKKPGAKLTHLKEQLKHKIALKRDEEWKQREQEMKEQEIEWDESTTEEDHLSEPCSPSTNFSDDNEDELEVDDVYIKKNKKKSKCAYIDDEADVSDEEINDSDEIEDEDEDEDINTDKDKNELHENSEDEKDSGEFVLKDKDEDSISDSIEASSKCTTFKRILESLEDDSRSSNIESVENTTNKDKKTSFSQITGKDIFDMGINENEQSSDNDSDIQVSQVHVENDLKHQRCQTPQTRTNSFDFISPVMQLTALNAQLEYEKEPAELKKQLLSDEVNSILIGDIQSQELSQQIRDFKKQEFTQDKLNLDVSKEPNVTESQLLELCSGTFGSQVDDAKESVNEFSDKTSQSPQIIPKENPLLSGKNIHNEKQKLNKDIMTYSKLRDVSSDEEDLPKNDFKNPSKKKVKKLDLSDDEEENSFVESSDNEEEEEEDEEKYIDYDSEENEIVMPKKDIKKYAAKFLEEEAELSESDCDVSADEDEKDLDDMELEEGDDEEIDQSQVKNQLEKLHMRQILDEDQKEVRILKELLFEDGDLYSESTRERKFKWRNMDKQEDNDNSQPLEEKDGWVDLSDDEEEAKWRKIKHEREKFLAEKMKNLDTEIEEDLNSSQIFKFGMKILKKRRINETEKQDTLLEIPNSKVNSRIPHTIAEMLNTSNLAGKSCTIKNVMQKRSFLARGEETLARLAALARQKETLPSINAKNFVFAHIDPSTENESAPPVETITKFSKAKKNR